MLQIASLLLTLWTILMVLGCETPDQVWRYRSPLSEALPVPLGQVEGDYLFAPDFPHYNFYLRFNKTSKVRDAHAISTIGLTIGPSSPAQRYWHCLRHHWMSRRSGGCQKFDLELLVTIRYGKENSNGASGSISRKYLARALDLSNLNLEIHNPKLTRGFALEVADSLGLSLWPVLTLIDGTQRLFLPPQDPARNQLSPIYQFYSSHKLSKLTAVTKGFRSPILQPILLSRSPTPTLNLFNNLDIPDAAWLPLLNFSSFGVLSKSTSCESRFSARRDDSYSGDVEPPTPFEVGSDHAGAPPSM